ncbi:MAG: ArsR family transcriptional regulator [Candidatus Heimdallarchaeota archaeon]|nr:ArsR family transcriptional regulator [Candidatus Heimdallarchaeota archaeon]
MDEKEFFELVGSDIRREILRSIAQEPKYLFQLAGELDRSQQYLLRHLQCLLEKGWLTQELVEGPHGPGRKLYRIAKNLSVRITLSQHSFDIDVLDIQLGDLSDPEDNLQTHLEEISKDMSILLSRAVEKDHQDYAEQIRSLNVILDKLGSIESFILSRKLTVTGELNETISMKLEGDDHRKDRELAYTIFSSSAPIKIDILQKEIKTHRDELLASLKRLNEKNLLPERGLDLMRNLEVTVNNQTE